MKGLYLLATCLLSMAWLPAAHAQSAVKEKHLSGRYPAGKGRVLIDNRYGKLDINTWDKVEVTVDITVTAKARTAAEAQRLLDRVSITQPGGSGINYKTVIAEDNSEVVMGAGFTIDYVINMPRRQAAEFINKHGDIDIEDVDGKVDIDLGYGALKAGAFKGSSKDIKISFGSASIPSIEAGTITASHSKLSVDKAGSIKVSNHHGKTTIGTIRDLDIDQKYGDLDIGSVHKLKSTVQFAGLTVDKLLKSAEVNMRYGGGAKFAYVGGEVDKISVQASYSNVSFHFDDAVSLAGNLQLSYGRVTNTANGVTLAKAGDEGKYGSVYRMKMGSGRGDMAVNASYGNVVFR